jgi:hypothetical protein
MFVFNSLIYLSFATKRFYLNEQSSTGLTMSQESVPATKFIAETFKLFKYSPTANKSDKTSDEHIEELQRAKADLKKYTMNQLTELAKKSNISVEAIKALQTDLVKLAGLPLKFKESSGQERDFVDGNLGTNTVDAYLDYQIKLINRRTKTSQQPTIVKPIEKIGGMKPTYQRK